MKIGDVGDREAVRCTHREAHPRASEPLAKVSAVASDTPVFQAYRGSTPPRFQNDVVLECAKILDWYRVPWLYEPRTFELEVD